MKKPRNQYSALFKFQVALAAVKADQTINGLASAHGVHPNQVSQWKRQLVEEGATVFERGTERLQREQRAYFKQRTFVILRIAKSLKIRVDRSSGCIKALSRRQDNDTRSRSAIRA